MTTQLESLAVNFAMRHPNLAHFIRISNVVVADCPSLKDVQATFVTESTAFITQDLLSNPDTNLVNTNVLTTCLSILARQFLGSNLKTYLSLYDITISGKPLLFMSYDLIALNILYSITKMQSKTLMSGQLIEFTEIQESLLNQYNEYLKGIAGCGTMDIIHITSQFVRSNALYMDALGLVIDRRLAPEYSGMEFYDEDEDENYTENYSPSIGLSTYQRDENSGTRGGTGVTGNPAAQNDIFALTEFLREVSRELPSELRELMANFFGSFTFSITRFSLNYKERLNEIFSGLFKDDFSFRKPNPRYLHTGMIMPSLVGNKVKLLFAIDHSGSISTTGSAEQLGAIDGVLAQYPNHETELVVFASEIRKTLTMDANDTLIEKVAELGVDVGEKGGTNFQAVINHIELGESLDNLSLIAFVSEDGCGGSIELSDDFIARFKGRFLLLFKDIPVSQSSATMYSDYLTSVGIEHDVVHYVI